ncbi:MAG: hypothetical protein ABSB96_04955 [Gaiellaceae bacterium]
MRSFRSILESAFARELFDRTPIEAGHEERWQLRTSGSVEPSAKRIAAALAELNA